MKKTSAVVFAMLLAVGCKDKWDKAISEMESFKDQMCACKDKACTDDVKKKMNDWEEKMSKEFSKDDKPPEKLMAKGDAIEKEMKECRKKFKDADAPPPAPTEAPPAAGSAAPAPAGSGG